MAPADEDRRVYRFGPVERRGIVGPLRLGQTICLGFACTVAVVVMRSLPPIPAMVASLVIASVGIAAAIAPVGGRAPVEWLPVLVSAALLRLRGEHAFRAGRASAGYEGSLDGSTTRPPESMPPALKGCRLLSARLADGSELGVVHDPELGAYTAVLALEARAVSLLPAEEHERRLERWGELLSDAARRGSSIRRLQVIERTAPAGNDELSRYFDEAGITTLPEDVIASYQELIEGSVRVYMRHSVLVAVQVDERRAWARAARDGRQAGGDRDEQASRVLVDELRALNALFHRLDVKVNGLLSPSHLAKTIRFAYDPFWPGTPDGTLGPNACDADWSTLRADSAWHRTYWISQWPRLPVGPVFLTPLLLGTETVRTVSIVIEPIAPDRSRRAAEAAVTSDEADDVRRESKGFRQTAKQRRQRQATERREEELADGHEELRYAGYVTVSGQTKGALLDSCAEVEQAARQSRLELTPCWGEQDVAFAQSALPIGRGLRRVRTVGGG